MTTRAAANLVRSLRIGDGRSAIVDSPTVAGRGFKVACSGRRIFESDRTRGARVETQVGTFRLRVLFLHQRAFSEAPSLSKAAFPVTALHTVFRIKGRCTRQNPFLCISASFWWSSSHTLRASSVRIPSKRAAVCHCEQIEFGFA